MPATAIAALYSYYQPEPVTEADLALMRCIDALHLEHPYAGSRMLRDFLRPGDYPRIGRKRVKTLMSRMGIEAHLPQAQHQQAAPQAPGLSLPVA